MELASAVRSIAGALGTALGPQLSASSVQMLHHVFSSLSSQDVLKSLFGNALQPHAGVACEAELNELLGSAAARQREALTQDAS